MIEFPSDLSVEGHTVSDMKKLQDAIAVISFAVAALLTFYWIPNFFPKTEISSITQYLMMSLAFIYYMHAYTLPTLRYLQIPQITFASAFATIFAIFYIFTRALTDNPVHLSWILNAQGVVYLLAIGLGEELVARGFIFGVLEKYGKWIAVLLSSFVFGLMHLNLYTGSDWDPYNAIYHVVSTTGFGILACAVMMATRSIWPAILMHAFSDWTVIFEEVEPPVKAEDLADVEVMSLWATFIDSLFQLTITVPFALLIFLVMWLEKKFQTSSRIEGIMIRLKLAEPRG